MIPEGMEKAARKDRKRQRKRKERIRKRGGWKRKEEKESGAIDQNRIRNRSGKKKVTSPGPGRVRKHGKEHEARSKKNMGRSKSLRYEQRRR